MTLRCAYILPVHIYLRFSVFRFKIKAKNRASVKHWLISSFSPRLVSGILQIQRGIALRLGFVQGVVIRFVSVQR